MNQRRGTVKRGQNVYQEFLAEMIRPTTCSIIDVPAGHLFEIAVETASIHGRILAYPVGSIAHLMMKILRRYVPAFDRQPERALKIVLEYLP